MAKRTKATIGRPTKLTPTVARAITRGVELGMTLERAATGAGVSRKTAEEWIARGEGRDQRQASPVFVAFAATIARARAKGEQTMLETIERAALAGDHGRPDWRARAWILERTRPEVYGQTVHVKAKVEQELTHGLEQLREHLDPPTLARVLRILAGRRGEQDARGDRTGDGDSEVAAD